ncbi:hypothetical protein ACIPYU_05625 [Paenarthrobacter nicotinovorans]
MGMPFFAFVGGEPVVVLGGFLSLGIGGLVGLGCFGETVEFE